MRRELTWQAVVTAVVVAAVISASYPYVVLKLGLGPNVSVVSAFLGAILLLVLSPGTHGENRWMNNLVQTAGTSAAMTAFMCVIAAAVDLTVRNPTMTPEALNGLHHIEPWPMFWWLSCTGGIGVLFTVLFRRHFVDDPNLVFADGVAAAETIVVLDTKGPEAVGKLRLLGLSALASAVLDFFRDGVETLADHLPFTLEPIPDWFFFSPLCRSFKVGIEWNLLSLGSGILIGLNVSLSMLAASVVILTVGPQLVADGTARDIVLANIAAEHRPEATRLIDRNWADLNQAEQQFVKQHGGKLKAYLNQDYFSIVLLWFMWPATGLMIASALTAVLLKWRSILDSFARLRIQSGDRTDQDVSLWTVLIGGLILTAALAVIQHQNFGMSYFQTVVAVLCSLPLILVGVRVLGETNNGPISVMMNGLQAVFALIWPGSIGHNLIAAGVSGSCNAQGEGTIQDYKTGKILGSTPRILTWVQLAAVPIGAAAVAIMYPLLIERYELGVKLTTPTGVKISNMAVLLSQGFGALPRGALLWTAVAAAVGVLISVLKELYRLSWLPSAAGFGFGLILPGTLNIPMAIGGILGWVWESLAKSSYDRYAVTLASGLIAGEAMLGGLVLPVLAWLLSYSK